MKSLFFVSVFVFLIVGCTRNLGDQSQIKIDLSKILSKASASVDEQISFVAVNVTGPGMARKTFVFDAFDNCQGDCENPPPAPSTVELEVPSGADRLVQVLVIAEVVAGDGSESEEFRYGEARADLGGGQVGVPVAVSSIAGSTNKEGSASGRYLFADGSGFTGEVGLEFDPPGNSPNMEVFKLEMFNGWFQIHLLDNIDLTYRLSNGHVMFGGPVKRSSSIFNGNIAVKKIITPEVFEEDGDFDQESLDAVGFWKDGQPDLSKNVCHDTTSVTSDHEFTDAGRSNPLVWPADFTITGGNQCTASDPLVTVGRIEIDGKAYGNGGDGAAPFRGPYMLKDNGDHYSVFGIDTSDPSQLTLSWKYLPGVINAKMVGSTAFFKVENGIDDEDFVEGGDGLDCDLLPALGFDKRTVNGATESVSLPIAGSDLGNTKVILCPRKPSGKHFRTAIETRCLGGSCGDGPDGLPEATKLKLAAPFQPPSGYPHLNNDACTTFEILAVDDSDNIAKLPNEPYAVDLAAGTGDFYHDPACASSITGGDFDLNGPVSHVWFKATTSPPADSNIVVSADAGETVALSSASTNPQIQTAATQADYRILATNQFFVEETGCEPIIFSVVDASDVPTSFSGSGSANLINSPGEFFLPSDCGGTAQTTVGMASGESNFVMEFRHNHTSATTGETLSINATGSPLFFTDENHSFDVNDPAATHARIETAGGAPLDIGNCIEFSVRTFEASPFKAPRAKISAPESYNITFSGVTGDLFADSPDCSVSANAQSSITVNQTSGTSESETFFFKPSSTGTLEFDGEAVNDPQFDADSDSFGISSGA